MIREIRRAENEELVIKIPREYVNPEDSKHITSKHI